MRKFIKKALLNGVIRVLVKLLANWIVALATHYNILLESLEKRRSQLELRASQTETTLSSNKINKYRKMSGVPLENNLKETESYKATMLKTLGKQYLNTKTESFSGGSRRKKPQLKLRWVFFCFFLIIMYVSLNNYLIIFIYMNPGEDKGAATAHLTGFKNSQPTFFSYFFYWVRD